MKLYDNQHGAVELVDQMGDDKSIVNAARVSYQQGTKTTRTDEKLINYLLAHRHTSPFEHVIYTFKITCPIFITRHIHRHRTFSYNEISARYSVMQDRFYIPSNMRTQHETNRQASNLDSNVDTDGTLSKAIQEHNEASVKLYQDLMEQGVARELARSVLPVSMYTEFFMTGNLHNFFHFIRLRISDDAQLEVRWIAKEMILHIAKSCPLALNAFLKTINMDHLNELLSQEEKFELFGTGWNCPC